MIGSGEYKKQQQQGKCSLAQSGLGTRLRFRGISMYEDSHVTHQIPPWIDEAVRMGPVPMGVVHHRLFSSSCEVVFLSRD